MKVALDTNILVYAEGLNGSKRRDEALSLIERLPQDLVVLPVQVLSELFNVLIRKAGRSRKNARNAVLTWHDSFLLADTSAQSMRMAFDLVVEYQIGTWDALIVAVAANSDCRFLLSEDLQDGFAWGGLTVVNPFGSNKYPALSALLKD